MKVEGIALQDHVVHTDHDGVEFAFAVAPRDEIPALLCALGLLAATPLSLAWVAYPAAAYFEEQSWWLVNEEILRVRWLNIGLLVSALSWLSWPLWGRARLSRHVRLEQHRLVLEPGGRARPIPIRDLRRVWVGPRGLRLEREDGTSDKIDLPLQDVRVLRELGRLLVKHAEHSGSSDAIPEGLQQLRGRPVPVSSPDTAR